MASPEPPAFSHQLLASLPTRDSLQPFHRARRLSVPKRSLSRFGGAERTLMPRSRGDVPRLRSSLPVVSSTTRHHRTRAARLSRACCSLPYVNSLTYVVRHFSPRPSHVQANFVLHLTKTSLRSAFAGEHCYVGLTGATCNHRREIFLIAPTRTVSFVRSSPQALVVGCESGTSRPSRTCLSLLTLLQGARDSSPRTPERLRSRGWSPYRAPDTFLGRPPLFQ